MSEADKIFRQLPLEAQDAFVSAWDGALSPAIARRGEVPDPAQKEAVEDLIKLFFVHGYSACLKDEKRRTAELRRGIEERFIEWSKKGTVTSTR